MGIPTLNVTFIEAAESTAAKTARDIVAVMVTEASTQTSASTLFNVHELFTAADIPAEISRENRAYIARAFTGAEGRTPKKVLLCVSDASAANYTEALNKLALWQFNWLAAPPDCSAANAQAIADWIAERRAEDAIYKAVLPDLAANSEAIVNFTTDGIKVGSNTYTSAQYCSRIAGIIASTPDTRAITFIALPEVEDITRLSKTEMDTAVNDGKLILMHDGVKVKIARGVTSLKTISAGSDTPVEFKKIKLVGICDTIKSDLRMLFTDEYIGRYNNSYDNKCLLLTAVTDYFKVLERRMILREGSSVGFDIAAIRDYLLEQSGSAAVADMDEQALKEADTGTNVFLEASIRPYDAIEDVTLNIRL